MNKMLQTAFTVFAVIYVVGTVLSIAHGAPQNWTNVMWPALAVLWCWVPKTDSWGE